jgi:hypothetical protein
MAEILPMEYRPADSRHIFLPDRSPVRAQLLPESLSKFFEEKFELLRRQGINACCRCPSAAGDKGATEHIRTLLMVEGRTDINPVRPIRIAGEESMGQVWLLLGFEVAEYTGNSPGPWFWRQLKNSACLHSPHRFIL